VLAQLDLVVGAVHSKFNLSKKAQTQRIIKAMENPVFSILAHPSGRLLGLREPYEVDMPSVIAAAKDLNVILELNAQPDRLDLDDLHCKAAKEAGVKIAVSTDAHSVNDLQLMRYGIGQARRGWLEAGDVVNTLSLAQLKKALIR
jgi:DNA polymerase (family 10)